MGGPICADHGHETEIVGERRQQLARRPAETATVPPSFGPAGCRHRANRREISVDETALSTDDLAGTGPHRADMACQKDSLHTEQRRPGGRCLAGRVRYFADVQTAGFRPLSQARTCLPNADTLAEVIDHAFSALRAITHIAHTRTEADEQRRQRDEHAFQDLHCCAHTDCCMAAHTRKSEDCPLPGPISISAHLNESTL